MHRASPLQTLCVNINQHNYSKPEALFLYKISLVGWKNK